MITPREEVEFWRAEATFWKFWFYLGTALCIAVGVLVGIALRGA